MHTPLRKLRKAQGMTLSQVASAVRLDVGNLSRIERGIQIASLDVAERLSTFFAGQITEMQILYPQRFSNQGNKLTVEQPTVNYRRKS